MILHVNTIILATISVFLVLVVWNYLGLHLQFRLKHRTKQRRKFLLRASGFRHSETLVIGFFHPYCNAGGGGERVLWAAVRATHEAYPNVFCAIYSGDPLVTKADIIARAKDAFGIVLESDRMDIVPLRLRYLVDAKTWPRFTLIGQSLGSMCLAYEAISSLAPDIFIDTMGYAFAYPLVRFVLGVPVASYTHYPTMTSDMLSRLSYLNLPKQFYWRTFYLLYSMVGQYSDIIMANSTWTMQHLTSIWALKEERMTLVYPPCDTALLSTFSVDQPRRKHIVCVAQFRPEKDHPTLLRAFAMLVHELQSGIGRDLRLILIGTVRGEEDLARVQALRELSNSLQIESMVDILTDVPWPEVLSVLQHSWIGTNAMWNEHFGIGVVEYMAAGLIPVVHDSAGPKLDIVTPFRGAATGFHADSVTTFAEGFASALLMNDQECQEMRHRCQLSSARFSESVFASAWQRMMARLVRLEKQKRVARS